MNIYLASALYTRLTALLVCGCVSVGWVYFGQDLDTQRSVWRNGLQVTEKQEHFRSNLSHGISPNILTPSPSADHERAHTVLLVRGYTVVNNSVLARVARFAKDCADAKPPIDVWLSLDTSREKGMGCSAFPKC